MSLLSVYALHGILFDENVCDQYLLEKNVFYATLPCDACGQEMPRNLTRWSFRCTSRKCRKENSLKKHTFFYGSMLKSSQIIYMAYLWLNKVTVSSAIMNTGHSSHTISSFYRHFRSLVASTLQEEDQVIGGQGIIVEVDETKMGKRKYNRGHRVDGVWVVAGVERTAE
jgi:hypothetical protein